MSKSILKIKKTERDNFVTKSFLVDCFQKYDVNINERFEKLEKRFDVATELLLRELAAIRSENKEFRLAHEELYRSDNYLDGKIDHLDKRVLRLETKAS